MNSGFIDKNPWHESVHLTFNFECQDCDTKIGYDEVPVGDFGDNFLEYCVAVSSEAQAMGWSNVGSFSFLCPKCTINKCSTS